MSGECVANPWDPVYEDSALGGCRICALDGSSCEACWESYGLASNGTCVAVSEGPHMWQHN